MHLAQSLATLRLDPAATTPLFRQLYDAIKEAILGGQLNPGMQLPPTRELAQLFGISRQTVLNAYAQLTAEGFLCGTTGKGTFISASLPLASSKSNDSVPALRPLSPRGQRFVDPRSRLNIHDGGLRAFRSGMPGLDVFPFEIWARLEARRWRRPTDQLGYSDPAGHAPLRELLAAYLRAARGVQCTPEQIVITSGSQQALFLTATLLLAPGDAAWVENPGYPGVAASLRAADARICAVPVDAQGLCVDTGAQDYPDAKLVYVTPSHQYPLGVTMSLQRRLALLTWAARNRAWVIEDDFDSEYRYTSAPLASLQSLDKAGCVIYIGTLSKVLFPGLRMGYMVLPPPLAEAFAQARASIDRHNAIVPQIVLADFIAEGHFGRHIKRTREVYADRRTALLHLLQTQLSEQLQVGATDAGLHLAVHFKAEYDDRAVVQRALQEGIEVRALSQFYLRPDEETAETPASPAGLILGFASIPCSEIKRGFAILRSIL